MSNRKKIFQPQSSQADAIVRAGRRRFMQQASAGIGAVTAALAGGKKSWYAYAEGEIQRRNMITIHCGGGWDSYWWHNAFPKEFAGSPFNTNDLSAGEQYFKDNTRITRDAETQAVLAYEHTRYTERAKTIDEHPGYAGKRRHFLGLGMRNAFTVGGKVDYSLFKDDILIWRGLDPIGGHGIGNMLTLHGSLSQYAISFGGLVAEALAERQGKRTLNYMQLTGTPGGFGANWAMVKGDQIPINVADMTAFQRLTQKAANDYTDAGMYNALNESVKRLGEEIGKNSFSLRRSQEIYQQFMNFFKGALDISSMGTQMAPFQALWDQYTAYAYERVSALYGNDFRSHVSEEIRMPYDNRLWTKFSFAPGAQFEDSLGYQAQLTAKNGIYNTIRNAAFSYAMAEFMIANGHSSVVDITSPCGDYHGQNDGQLVMMTITYSLYHNLLRRLKDHTLRPDSIVQKNLLEDTLVVMFTEFDRSQWLGIDNGPDWRGTEHGMVQSVLLAGYGVAGGSVVGDIGYRGLTTNDTTAAGANGSRYARALGVDRETGQLSDAAPYLNTSHVFPTVMRIMDVTVPANQITDAEPVLGVLKGYNKK